MPGLARLFSRTSGPAPLTFFVILGTIGLDDAIDGVLGMNRLRLAKMLSIVAVLSLSGCAYLNPGDRLAAEPKQSIRRAKRGHLIRGFSRLPSISNRARFVATITLAKLELKGTNE
jgi:hypothetical protein